MVTSLEIEELSQVELSQDGKLYLCLWSGGKPSYQYVYRAAAGVYWDEEKTAFRFDTINDGQVVKWFLHTVKIVETEMGLSLRAGEGVQWINLSAEVKDAIQCAAI
jgi:hypothetical protein